MSPILLVIVVAVLLLLALAVLARRRATAKRAAREERHRLRRQELEVGQVRDPGFHSWQAEEFAFEHEVKRVEAEKASQAAQVYSHLAEEQARRAAELIEESEDAAANAGLEDIRGRLLETDAGEGTATDQ